MLAALCVALPLTGLAAVPLATPAQAVSTPTPIDPETLTASEAATLMAQGKLTSVQLTQAYIDRINALNKSGPGLNAVTQLNRQALTEAAHVDELRRSGTVLSPMMGMPVLMKDLIDVKGMYTSAGNFSLRNSYPADDAGLVKKLRANGVVILGKLGLSEYANYFGNQPSGFGNLTGQVLSGIDADQNPSGSSSGTGSAMAAGLSLLGIGTETSGSIISPSRTNGLVGLRPTVGLVPGTGIAPISASQDTAGPMTKTVEDAAYTLQAIAGYDADNAAYYHGIWGPGVADEDVIPPVPHETPDYLEALDPDYVRGKRIGWNGSADPGDSTKPAPDTPLRAAYDALVAAGAIMVYRPAINPGSLPSGNVLSYEAHRDIDHYYQHLGPKAPIKSLEQELAVNAQESHQALKFGNGTHRSAYANDVSAGSAATTAYTSYLVEGKRLAHEGIDRTMTNDTPADPSDDFIAILGSVSNGARAGYPQITVPMGYTTTHRRTQDVSVNGGAYDEKDLLGVAYVIEQGTKLRQPASEVNPSMYRCADTVPAPAYAERGDCNPDYDSVMTLLGGKAPAPLAFSLETESAQSLAERLRDGTLTVTDLTRAYLYRIALSNAAGPATQAVRSINAEALAQAAAADATLARARTEDGTDTLGPLFGLPVLVNDGFDQAGKETTGGSIALQGRVAGSDSTVIARLKDAGAIVLGTTNVTELGSMVDDNMPEGYSSLGGQVLLPSDTDKTPAGASAGSAAAAASGLAALTIGMETSTDSAQIAAPANAAGVVGLKPTVGLVSRTGTLPVAKSQDAPGPITRSVYDAAAALTAIAGEDASDSTTAGAPSVDYTAGLTPTALAGKRIAIVSSTVAGYRSMASALTVAGATTTQVTPTAPTTVPSIVGTEFKRDLNAYLAAGATGGARSLAEIIAYNADHEDEGLKYQQRTLVASQAVSLTDSATATAYATDLADGRAANRAALDAVLTNGTPTDTSDDYDAVMVPSGSALIGYADRAGYPTLSLPAGYGVEETSSGRDPVGVTLIGTAFSEATLLADAYSLERATNVRLAPSWTNPSMWRCVPGSTFFTGAFCNPGDRLLLDADPNQGVAQPYRPVVQAISSTPLAFAFGQTATLGVHVTGIPGGATGTVTFAEGGTTLGTAPIEGDGGARLPLAARSLHAGTHTLTVTYAGDGGTATGQVTVSVAQATASATVRLVPQGKAKRKVVAKRTRAKVAVTVRSSAGVAPTGTVVLTGKGIKRTVATLRSGTVTLRLPKLAKPGRLVLTVRYGGTGDVAPATAKLTVTVRRR